MIVSFLPVVFVCAAIVAMSVGLGQWLSVALPEVSNRLDVKPFNCRPCLTFHLCWTMMTAAAWIAGTFRWFVAGVAIALVVFWIVRYIDNKKIEK